MQHQELNLRFPYAIHALILLSYLFNQENIYISGEMDESGRSYTECNKLVRNRKIMHLCNSTYMRKRTNSQIHRK